MERILSLVVALLFSCTLLAEGKEVQFAGLAFITEHQDVGATFPHAQRFLREESLNALLWEKLSSLQNSSFILKADHLADITRSDSVIVLAIALDAEIISTEKIDGLYKVIAGISGQALFFDFKQQAVVASYPINVEHRLSFEAEPTEQQRFDAIRDVLFRTDENGLIGHAVNTLSAAKLRFGDGARLGIGSVSILDEARDHLPGYLRENPRRAETMVAQAFIRFLSESHQVSILPYTKGHAIGNRMATRLANGQVFNLEVPEADFSFDLTLERFKKAQFAQVAAGASWIYGAAVSVSLTEPLSGKKYLHARFKNGETKRIPSSQETIDDWPSFQESLFGLLTKLSNSFKEPRNDWARSASDNKSIADQLEATEKVIQLCK